MRTILGTGLLALLFASSVAFADTSPATPAPSRTADASKMAGDDCARARKQNRPCVIDMGKGDVVDGKTPTAGGSAIGIISFGPRESLIRIRKDFIVEILKSAEDID